MFVPRIPSLTHSIVALPPPSALRVGYPFSFPHSTHISPPPVDACVQIGCLEKGLKHVPAAPAGIADPLAPTATPAPEVEAPPQQVEEQDPSTAASPVKAEDTQQPTEESLKEAEPPPPGEERDPSIGDLLPAAVSPAQPAEDSFSGDNAAENQGDGMDEGQKAQASEDKSDLVQEESEIAAGEQEHEAVAKMDESKSRGDLLLELIRSFRGGMLRVDSNLRGAMFRSLRYLVGARVAWCVLTADLWWQMIVLDQLSTHWFFQVRTSEDAELIRRQRFGLFIALALAREHYELWERMQVKRADIKR